MTVKYSNSTSIFKTSKSEPVEPMNAIVFDSVSKRDYEIICRNQSASPDASNLQLDVVCTNDIYGKIVEILSSEKVVEKIFLIRDVTTFSIWTSIIKNDKESRRALYKKELELMRFFSPIEFHFDFHIAYPEDTEELRLSGVKIIFSRKK